MPTFDSIKAGLRLPILSAPMFIVSGPDLVIAQCKAGVIGSFPSLNARPPEELDKWLTRIETETSDYAKANPGRKVGPFAVNLIVNRANKRLPHDTEVVVRHKVPIVITSLSAPTEIVPIAPMLFSAQTPPPTGTEKGPTSDSLRSSNSALHSSLARGESWLS